MCRAQCLLAFFALSINYVNSWDIAVTTGDQLEFYSNGTKTSNEGIRFKTLTALAYDAVHNMLLFVDKDNDNASIFSYHLASRKYQPLVRRKSDESIQGLAFDPVTTKLFWTDSNKNEKSIYWKSLKSGTKNNIYGDVLFKFDTQVPRAIAVDSCRGYIYWTNTNITKATIERAKFDGSERQVVIDTDIFMPVSIAIDQQAKKLYWADDKEGIHYSIESSDLDGINRLTMLAGTYHQPNALTISKDTIYWIDWGFKSVWKVGKNHQKNKDPDQVLTFNGEVPFGIVANYQIEDQTTGVPECAALSNLSQNKSAINDSFNIPSDVGLFCLHGIKIDGKLACKCSPGYTGERCEVSLCSNYCIKGSCELTPEGEPKCRCNHGFTGERCEVDVCAGHCLNSGVCLVQEDKAACLCKFEYHGERCETYKPLPTSDTPPVVTTTVLQPESCNCTREESNNTQARSSIVGQSENASETLVANDGDFVVTSSCNDGWDPIRDPIIMVLGTLCGLFCVACAVLITKILQLKKRPRIKKRIIVNKNVTPLTARPDQCEITIENCCNMNICETPCFEPRSTIRPTLLDAKPGKEEKKNLIANMEYPDDY